MKKVLMALSTMFVLGLAGCASTDDQGGDKGANKNSRPQVECETTGSRLRRTC